CSEAEPPDARFDAGPVADSSDDADDVGGRDQACLPGNRCDSEDLLCVNENDAQTCRLVCDLTATDDPCGDRQTCDALGDGSGACLPAGQLDEGCPCDEGFACALLDDGNGGQRAVCKQRCETDAAAGDAGVADAVPCPAAEQCAPLQGNDFGVCIG
ncbi:MAG: hypothetical protein ACO3JL_19995, partial [Myxococcota bacterium]